MDNSDQLLSTWHDTASPVHDGVLLLLQVPRTNDKKELAAEQMFASLHGLLALPAASVWHSDKRERISFEIAVRRRRIGFYVWVPVYLKHYVEEQIYAQYPTVHITEVADYCAASADESLVNTVQPDGTAASAGHTQLSTELALVTPDALPIKTFQSFEVDPLAAITATLARLGDHEEAWIQLLIRPAQKNWHKRSERYIARLKGGANFDLSGIVGALWQAPTDQKNGAKLTDYDQTRVSAAEEKSQKLAFETALRIVYRGHTSPEQAKLQVQSIVASYKQFNSTYLNGFTVKSRVAPGSSQTVRTIADFRNRAFSQKGFICNIEEIATLYHLPHTNVETPFILWSVSQTAEPPANLPIAGDSNRQTVSPAAVTNFRGHNTTFGIPRADRGRHLYIIGQTGAGKSGMLELLTISDIYSPYGFAVIDPHGDYALNVLRRIPPERAKDVVYFNPADTDYPIGFNPLEVLDPKLKTHTCSELIGVIKRMFEYSWGPRLEYILRYSVLALLDYPDATMLDITRILTEKKFRAHVLEHVTDPVVRNFWLVEFASWNDKFLTEAIAPILNKIGAFTANPLVRNIIGQPHSSFNIRRIMDEHKILIVNLSRGLVGEDNASLLGALMVTKIQMAAMSRADIPAEQRTPFYLYVDEFQNFATDSFAVILSEARKYGLNLTVANQYTAQMLPEVKDAVFGNVGSIMTFRLSADDARTMLKYFEPKFTDYDLVHMHNRHFAISMTIDGEKVQAFSAISLTLPGFQRSCADDIIAASRAHYATPRGDIEASMSQRYSHDTFGRKKSFPVQSKPACDATVPPDPQPPEAQKPAAKRQSPSRVMDSLRSRIALIGIHAATLTPQPTPQQTPAASAAPDKPARKRRRRRRKKTTDSAKAPPASSSG